MFRNRFILVLSALSLFLAAMAVSRPYANVPPSADLSRPPRPAIIPVTGANRLSDYYERHSEIKVHAANLSNMTDYFFRHPQVRVSKVRIDLSDYFLRH